MGASSWKTQIQTLLSLDRTITGQTIDTTPCSGVNKNLLTHVRYYYNNETFPRLLSIPMYSTTVDTSRTETSQKYSKLKQVSYNYIIH